MTTAVQDIQVEDNSPRFHDGSGGGNDNNEPDGEIHENSAGNADVLPAPDVIGTAEPELSDYEESRVTTSPSFPPDCHEVDEPVGESLAGGDDTPDPSSTGPIAPAELPDISGQEAPQAELIEDGSSIADYQFHELAMIFPDMDQIEFAQLKESIEANGQLHEPIALFEGKILDGRHRALACQQLGIMAKFVIFDGPGTPSDYVLARNLHRRHLDESQRAMIAAKISRGGKGRPSKNAQIQALSQDDAASRLNVGRSSVQHARRVIDSGIPELAEAVNSKQIPVSAAARIAGEPKATQPQSLKDARLKRAAGNPRKKPPACPEKPAGIGEIIAAPVDDPIEAPSSSTTVARFADACSTIDACVSDVVDKDSRQSEIHARIARAKATAKARQAEYLRRVILVTHEQTLLDRFGPAPDYLPPKDGESPEPVRFDDVVNEILGRFATGAVGDPDRLADAEPGYGSRDLAIWQDRRMIALVRRGAQGLLVVTRFDR